MKGLASAPVLLKHILFYLFSPSAFMNIPFCECARVSIYTPSLHQMWDQKSLATCLSACLRVRLHVHMHANSSGRHGQLSGEADNSPKCCPWFRVLMNSTAEEAPDREPCMVNDWLLMQPAFGFAATRWKKKEGDSLSMFFVLIWCKTEKKTSTSYYEQKACPWEKLPPTYLAFETLFKC